MTISFSGLASGLDTSSWVESLVALKQAKIDTLEEEKETVLLSKETLNNIKSFFSSFRTVIEKVTDAQFGIPTMDLFAQNIATSANLDVLTAIATTDAKEAEYKVEVNQLATGTTANSNYSYMTTIIQTTTASNDSKLINLGVKAGNIGVTLNGIERGVTITEDDTIQTFIDKLKDEKEFGTENPFPSVPVSSKYFSADGNGYSGGVTSYFMYFVVKGLMNYNSFIFARECTIRHMYFILDTLHPDAEKQGDAWEIYRPMGEGPATVPEGMENRKRYLPMLGLVTIALVIENIIGLEISLPRKTVNWTMQSLEEMGIEDLSLKKNNITILSNKNVRGWEIRLESEKLYYFTIHLLDEDKKKTLPIPSGKCSMLIDKL